MSDPIHRLYHLHIHLATTEFDTHFIPKGTTSYAVNDAIRIMYCKLTTISCMYTYRQTHCSHYLGILTQLRNVTYIRMCCNHYCVCELSIASANSSNQQLL
eukprot:351877_1